MTRDEKYKEALERASKLRVQNPFDTVGQMVEHIFPELEESEDERTRKELIEEIAFITPNNDELDDECNVLPTYQKRIDKYRAWLEKQKLNTSKREIDDAYLQGICDAKHEIEKQGEQTQFDYEHADITQKDFAPIEPKMLNADEVIAWLEKHIIEWKGQDLIKTFTPNSPAGKSYIVEQFKEDFGL